MDIGMERQQLCSYRNPQEESPLAAGKRSQHIKMGGRLKGRSSKYISIA
jgi:hypothetical protein